MDTGIMSSEKTQNRRVMSAETVVQNMQMTSRIRISTFMITLHVRLLLLAGGTVGTYCSHVFVTNSSAVGPVLMTETMQQQCNV